MAIRHLISEPITILTPCKNGRIWIRYNTGRKAEVNITELVADGSFKEMNAAVAAVDTNWDWSNFDSPEWHRRGTA
jgi:hypothetical protein